VDYSFLVHLLDALDHLDGNEEHCLEVELALAALEKVFEGGAEQVHHHNVKLLVWYRVVGADVVEAWDAGLATQLVDKFALPEEHDVLLILGCFFLQ